MYLQTKPNLHPIRPETRRNAIRVHRHHRTQRRQIQTNNPFPSEIQQICRRTEGFDK